MTSRFAKPEALGDDPSMTGRIYSIGYEGLEVKGFIRSASSVESIACCRCAIESLKQEAWILEEVARGAGARWH